MSDQHNDPVPRCADELPSLPPELAAAIDQYRELDAVPDDERGSAWYARRDVLQRRGNELLAPHFNARILELRERLSRLADGALGVFEEYARDERLTGDVRKRLRNLMTDGLNLWRELNAPFLPVTGDDVGPHVSEFLKLASDPRPPIIGAVEGLNAAVAGLCGGKRKSVAEKIPKYANAVLKYLPEMFAGGEVLPSGDTGAGGISDQPESESSECRGSQPTVTGPMINVLKAAKTLRAFCNDSRKTRAVIAKTIDPYWEEGAISDESGALGRMSFLDTLKNRPRKGMPGGCFITQAGLEYLDTLTPKKRPIA